MSLTALYGLVKFNQLYPRYTRAFVLVLIVCILLQFIAYYYSHESKRNNHFIINLYFFILDSSVLGIYYVASPTKKHKTLIKVLLLVYLFFALWNIIIGQGFFTYNTYTRSLGATCVIISSIYFLSTLFLADTPVNYFSVPIFWFATGWLFYYSGVIVYFSLLGYIVKHNLDPEGNIYAIIMLTLESVLYILMFIGFYTASKWKKEKSYLQSSL